MPGLIDAHTHPAIVDQDIFDMAEWPPTYVAARASRVLAGCSRGASPRSATSAPGSSGWPGRSRRATSPGPRMFYGGKQLSQTGGAGRLAGAEPPGLRRQLLLARHRGDLRRRGRGPPGGPRGGAPRRAPHQGLPERRGRLARATGSTRPSSPWRNSARSSRRRPPPTSTWPATPTPRGPSTAAWSAGVRSIEHGNLMDASSIPLFKKYGAFYVPTIVTYHDPRRPVAGRAAARRHRGEARAGHRRRARRAGDGAQGPPADRLRHRPVRRHARSAAAGVHHPVRDPAARRPDQGGHDHRGAAAAARGRARGGRARRAGRPAGHRREPAGRHPGADHPQHDAEAHHEGRQDRQERAAYVVTSRRRLPSAPCRRPSGRRRAHARSASRPG